MVKYGVHGPAEDVTPPSFNARTRVHEYGGAAVLVREGTVYFANFSDQKLYRQSLGESPQPIGQTAQCRYADAVFDGAHRRLILVREDHRVSDSQPTNTVAAVAIDGSSEIVLVEGNDFYSNPRLSPDGRKLAWLTWNHPHMPWMSTELWVGELDQAGQIVSRRKLPARKLNPSFSRSGRRRASCTSSPIARAGGTYIGKGLVGLRRSFPRRQNSGSRCGTWVPLRMHLRTTVVLCAPTAKVERPGSLSWIALEASASWISHLPRFRISGAPRRASCCAAARRTNRPASPA